MCGARTCHAHPGLRIWGLRTIRVDVFSFRGNRLGGRLKWLFNDLLLKLLNLLEPRCAAAREARNMALGLVLFDNQEPRALFPDDGNLITDINGDEVVALLCRLTRESPSGRTKSDLSHPLSRH